MPQPKSGGIYYRSFAPRSRAATGLLKAHDQLSELLTATHHPQSKKLRVDVKQFSPAVFAQPELRDLLVGVSIGPSRPRASGPGIAPPGAPSLRIYVKREMSREDIAEFVHKTYGSDLLKDKDLPYEVIVTESARLLSNVDRMRPAACGLSCSHANGEAGTIGFFGRGRGDDTNIYLISNNHVLANINGGKVGDPIYQPSVYDHGTAADAIATLFRWVIISPTEPNVLDCASAIVRDAASVRYDFVQFIKGVPSNFTIDTEPSDPGQRLGKCGRSTEVKAGRLQSVDATIVVDMGGWNAVFRNQIEIADETDPFSDDGDSGSLVWNFDEKRHPVGLLFARRGNSTYANPIGPVLDTLKVDILKPA
ncbi:MAG: hypothetical protein WC378_09420 [Opitutaceae bacterium]|jgi:hypothetical protein